MYGLGSPDKVYGGAGNDLLYASAGNDVLQGGAGRDIIEDEIGHNRMWGGTGADTFMFSGDLPASAFHVGTHATGPNQHIIYNPATGIVYFDADGSGSSAQYALFALKPHTALTYLNFDVHNFG